MLCASAHAPCRGMEGGCFLGQTFHTSNIFSLSVFLYVDIFVQRIFNLARRLARWVGKGLPSSLSEALDGC